MAAASVSVPLASGFQAAKSWVPRGAAARISPSSLPERPTLRVRSSRVEHKMVAVRSCGA